MSDTTKALETVASLGHLIGLTCHFEDFSLGINSGVPSLGDYRVSRAQADFENAAGLFLILDALEGAGFDWCLRHYTSDRGTACIVITRETKEEYDESLRLFEMVPTAAWDGYGASRTEAVLFATAAVLESIKEKP